MSATDAVCTRVNKPADDSHSSYPRTDMAHARGNEAEPESPRLETTDAHQSPTDCDLGSPGNQHRKATELPVIHVDEEPDLQTCVTSRESSADSSKHFDKPSSSPGVVTVADQVRTDADSCPRNDKKMPADRNLSVEDN